MKRIILILIGLLLGLFTQTYAQVQLYTKQELNQDIDSLYAIIREIHPNMFENISQSEFENKLAGIKKQIKDSMNRIEFFNLISPIVADIGDGHTSLFYPRNDLETINAKLFPYPVEIKWRDSTATIIEDRSMPKTGIPIGSKILQINNISITKLIGKMYCYSSGEKEFYKATSLTYLFTPLLYSFFNDSTFTIQYEIEGRKDQKIVHGIAFNQRYPTIPQQKSNSKACSLNILPDSSIAIITIFNFFDRDFFTSFLDSAFTAINAQKINDLIIDIRRNGGGNSRLGDDVFQYISSVPFEQFGETVIKTSPRQKEYLKKAYNIVTEYPNGIRYENDTTLIKLRENKLRYNGNKYLLISNVTFSSAASFSWAFQYFNMGKIIGEETGGLAVCFGDVIMQTLPNTKLDLGISHKKFHHYGATDNDTHGTIPDYEVPADKALDYTIDLIMKGRK